MVSLWNRGRARSPSSRWTASRSSWSCRWCRSSSRWSKSSPPARAAPAASAPPGRLGERVGPDSPGPVPRRLRLRCARPTRRPSPSPAPACPARLPFVHRRDADRFLLGNEAVAGVDDLHRLGLRPFSSSTMAAAAILAWLFAMLADFGIAGAEAWRRPARARPSPPSTPWCASRRRTSGCWW